LARRALFGLLYQPRMINDDVCEAVGEMKIGRGHRNTRRKPVPVPLCAPQSPHDVAQGSKPGRRSGKPATNRLNCGTAKSGLTATGIFQSDLQSLTSGCTSVVTHPDLDNKARNIRK
jgi:hypothetical protein